MAVNMVGGAAAAEIDDIPGDVGTTALLFGAEPVTGEIDVADDQDWYRFEAEAGLTYIFDLEGSDTGGGSIGDTFLRIFDATGNEIAADDDGGEGVNSRLAFLAGANDTLFVSAGGYGDSTGTFTLRTRTIVDVPSNTSTTAAIGVGGSVTGTMDFEGDSDWFRVEVEAGKTYIFDVDGSLSDGDPIASPYVGILDADGNELRFAFDYDGDGKALAGFTARSNGFVFAAAGSYDGDIGDYALGAQELVDDLADNPETTAALAVGGSAIGTIDFQGDGDWFRVEVEAGRTYVFDLEGVATSAGTLGNPFLQLADADGTILREDYDSGSDGNARLGFSATTTGAVFVSTGGSDEGTGTFRLSAAEIVGDPPDNATTPAEIQPGGEITGSIDYVGDEDWFRIDVLAGHTYVFDVEGLPTLRGTLGDPYLIIDDNQVSSEHYLVMNPDGGWYDWPVEGLGAGGYFVETDTAPTVLAGWPHWQEDAGGNGHFYKFVATGSSLDWETANSLAMAATAGAYLASTTLAGENAFLRELRDATGANPYAWLGGLQPDPRSADEPSGGWTWTTGESFGFSNWGAGEPNNIHGGGGLGGAGWKPERSSNVQTGV